MFLDHVALHAASFTTMLPFGEVHFALGPSSLATHNVSAQRRKAAVAELARVVAPGGGIILLELMGYAAGYEEALRHVRGWKNVEVSMESAEVLYDFGPCQILLARKPELQTVQ